MNPQKTILSILATAAFSLLAAPVNAQVNEQAARESATRLVRSFLESTMNYKSDQFLATRRDEELEESLAIAVGGKAGSMFIFKASLEGAEIRENSVGYHVVCDWDPLWIVVVNPREGSAFRVHGFGHAESLAEFEKLMTSTGMRVSSAYQAESVAEFYRKINPENFVFSPVGSLIDLKADGVTRCQYGAKSLDAGEAAFNAWWKRSKRLFSAVSFEQLAAREEASYLVRWIDLSSSSRDNCGGDPLRVELEVGLDGHVSEPKFSALIKH